MTARRDITTDDPKDDPMPDNRIDFDTSNIDRLVREFDATIHRATTTPVEVDPGGKARHNDPNKAKVSRGLLRAADLADQISSEVRSLYWQLKGQDDPRTTPLTTDPGSGA